MFREPFPAEPRKARTSGSSSKNSSELRSIPCMSLDLTPGAGTLLDDVYWESLSPWRGESLILNTGPSPRRGAAGSTLWSTLEAQPHPRYFLTRKACAGIIRRASERGKPLPPQLRQALEIQAGLRGEGDSSPPMAFAANQRDEVRDLHDVAGALGAQPGMKQQTFVASGVVTKGNGDCFLTEDVHNTLSGGGGQAGQGYPCVLCLNDQGGQYMNCSENITGTLRAEMNAHQPLILESNQDHAVVREDGVSPTLPASMGMGGGYVPMVNVPLVGVEPEVYCIVGNVIDRQPQNGGNGCGYQKDVAYTLTCVDHHAYLKLKAKEQKVILEYLRTLSTHLEVTVNGRKFYLVHGFPAENVHDEVWFRPDMNDPNPKTGYQVIIGHTKVLSLIKPEEKKIAFAMDLENRGEHLKIYHGPGFIDIDCGCGYDMPIKALACIRLEDMLEYYT